MPPDVSGRFPVGRTWRQLPAAPPSTLRPVDPRTVEPPPEESVERPRLSRFVAAGAVVVALGFIVGMIVPPPSFGVDPTEGESAAVSTLPEQIVPTLPPDSTFPELPPSLAPSDPLFRISTAPEGFEVTANSVQVAPARVDQLAVLSAGSREIVVEASTPSDGFELPDGVSISVRGVEGIATVDDDGQTLSWIEPGDIVFVVRGTDGVNLKTLLQLAESLEVS